MKTSMSLRGLFLATLRFSHACLLPEERGEAPPSNQLRRQVDSGTGTPIGTGDRFNGGKVAPQGLGTRPTSESFSTILSLAEIESGLQALASAYGFSTFTAPHATSEKRNIVGAKVGGMSGTCSDAYHVFLSANIHARERGAADGLLYFMSDILYANQTGTGLAYGTQTYTNAQVVQALSAGVVFIPNANPDGVAWDQSTDSCWRKNRRPAPTGSSFGVDANRNFDFLWDYQNQFASRAGLVASDDPSSPIYHGTAAFSEPEAQNLKWVLDTFASVRWFVDLHSFMGGVLYSWGSDTDQSSFPAQTFLNDSYNSVRGISTDTPGSDGGYGEYTPTNELNVNVAAANRIAAGMTAAAKRTYKAKPASELSPTSGASDDYAYSRHFASSSLNLVHAFTIEFGFGSSYSCPFYPTVEQYNTNLREIGSGFMETLLAAVDLDRGPGGC